jgi:hypothetical protein
MTDLEKQIRQFILRLLLAARDNPMPDSTVRAAIVGAFPHVAFSGGDLGNFIKDAEDFNFIAGTNDDVFGLMWALTPKGKIRAQQLR